MKPFKKYIQLVFFLLACNIIFSCKKDKAAVNCYPGATLMDTAVLLVLGQSNAANFGEKPYVAECPNTLNFYEGSYYPLSDPLKGANGERGSVWSRLGDLLVQNGFAKTIIIAPAAVGGTTLQQWKPGGELNHLITETITSLQLKGLKITHVLWHQGESDNAVLHPSVSPTENAEQYRSDFLELVGQLRALQVDAPVFIAVTSRCGSILPDTALQRVQRELTTDSLKIFNGPDTDLLGSQYRYDDCHFNENGLNIHALMWADILFAH